jgi:SAM-dependent methyltransferase
MRELYEDRFSKDDPYNLEQTPEAKIINDYKIGLLHRIFAPAGTYRRSLDMGCGEAGIFKSHPQCKGTEFSISLDLSLAAVRRCRDRHVGSAAPMYFAVADAQHLPFADELFDFIYCGEVLEHLPHAATGMEEIHRVLQTRGEAVLTVPNEREYVLCPDEHISSFTYYTFKSAVSERFKITLEKGLYLNETYPWDLIRASDPQPMFQELLELGESCPEDSFGLIFKVQPLSVTDAVPPGSIAGESVFSDISPQQLASRARILFPYRIRSHIPFLGPLIAWVRVNMTSHLKEPYIDRLARQQTDFNLMIVALLCRLVRRLEGPIMDATAQVLSIEKRQQELQEQNRELRLLIDERHAQLKQELEDLKCLVGSPGESGVQGDDNR